MATTRKYELKKRAERLEETRSRITEATVELHRTVGPAATQITEVARRAGVQRVTVYNHFPDEASLLAACSAHWQARHPVPDPSPWLRIKDPGERLRVGLRALYAWYRETEPMTANIMRDVDIVTGLRPFVERIGGYLDNVRGILTEPLHTRGRRRARVEAAARAALGFHTWRAMSDLSDAEAAELGAGLVELAARA